MSYLLDTTLLLDFAHGRRTAIELVDRLFAEVEPLYTCDVVTCEALSGGDDIERAAIEGCWRRSSTSRSRRARRVGRPRTAD